MKNKKINIRYITLYIEMAAYIRYIYTYSRGELPSCKPCTLTRKEENGGRRKKEKRGGEALQGEEEK